MPSPPSGPRRATLLLLLLAVLHAGPAPAQERVLPDGGWWAGAGTLLGGALLLDDRLRTGGPGDGTAAHAFSDRLNPLGNPRYLVPVIAGGYLAGRLADAPELSAGSVHVLAALLAAGVANGTIKSAVGRERPVGGDPHAFRPFNLDNRWQSFPSGHVTVAFSIAGSLSAEADRPWVTALSYATASLVGWSRVYEDKHWASDVVGGAIIGTVSSRVALALIHRHRPHDRPATSRPVTLVLLRDGVAVRVAY